MTCNNLFSPHCKSINDITPIHTKIKIIAIANTRLEDKNVNILSVKEVNS